MNPPQIKVPKFQQNILGFLVLVCVLYHMVYCACNASVQTWTTRVQMIGKCLNSDKVIDVPPALTPSPPLTIILTAVWRTPSICQRDCPFAMVR